ncbi:MAG: KTSC domain-containing protein [Bifidobacteriaceae bacterium]|jgi:hypothetical protein|nr:KTSC domain-containing protein [Bifidobacteriaceae bacterium]
MNRDCVNSSNISTIGYDPQTQTLEIEFHSDSVYQYSNVPQNIYNNLKSANSHGKYFNEYIKNTYSTQKIS